MTMQQVTGRERQDMARAPDGASAGVATADIFVPATREGAGVSVRTMEIATSLAFAAAGAVALWDSARLGAGWASDGPQSGYFPFWIGVLLVLAAAGNLFAVCAPGRRATRRATAS
jgi:hypothetical protein